MRDIDLEIVSINSLVKSSAQEEKMSTEHKSVGTGKGFRRNYSK